MSTSSKVVAAIGVLCTFIVASGGPGDVGDEASGRTATAPPSAATFARAEPGVLETRRIQGHLLDVEGVLRRRATDALSASQRERRNTALNWLREYRERGEFPRNDTHAGRVPVFVDEHGTPCAVAYLLQRSGREDLAREIASADNNVYAWELAGDARFSEWLDETGLTLDEAARIQPAYADGCICPRDAASNAWQYVLPLSVLSAVVSRLERPEGWRRPVFGAINGAFAVAHAGFAWNAVREWQDSSIGAEVSTAANAALALVSGYTAWSLLRSRTDEPAASGSERGVATALRSQRPRLLAPSAAWVGGGLGLQVRLVH
ncbi:MAG: hypothetical protein F4012_12585 [Gemmatimonadales bacterium]|nr:hypothetical protein [Gemmatimonadales bacterium]MYL07607.1 hypothetical protein [Gemmatimonadales bacterium]